MALRPRDAWSPTGSDLAVARILLGVSGGIAAYKAVEVVRLATAAGHSARVIQTPASRRFVGAATFEAVTGAPVLVDEFEPDPARGAFPGDRPSDHDHRPSDHDPISHLELVRRCDVLAVVPASANTLAKLAGGLADNLLTSAALANTAPLVLAPAMNSNMWEHPATQANLDLLRARGARVVEPATGRLASEGEWGVGPLGRCGRSARRRRGRAFKPRALRVARSPRAGDRGRDSRADRPGPLRGQPLLGADGPGPGRRGRPPGGRGHADRRQRLPAGAPRRPRGRGLDRRGAGLGGAGRSFPAPTSC